MAFLCPVRIRRGKKKSTSGDVEPKDIRSTPFTGMGRITGSASIETLVRVGIEKENGLSPDSKMVVLHDFTPCVDDELQVKRGQIVNILYRENDWVYVIAEDTRLEGFIPHSYCTPYNSHLAELALNNVKKKLPRDQQNSVAEVHAELNAAATAKQDAAAVSDSESCAKRESGRTSQNQQHSVIGSSQGSLHSSSSSQPEIQPFFKDSAGRFVVFYTFIARDEDDISVERGEFVTVLNRDDSDWYWVIRSDGQEGFVPSAFIYPADIMNNHLTQQNVQQPIMGLSVSGRNSAGIVPASGAVDVSSVHSLTPQGSDGCLVTNSAVVVALSGSNSAAGSGTSNPAAVSDDDLPQYHNTELVMLYDYKAQAPDDLTVKRGEWIYADLNNQTVDGWLWAYAPKTRKYGFIPKAYARPPAMTSL